MDFKEEIIGRLITIETMIKNKNKNACIDQIEKIAYIKIPKDSTDFIKKLRSDISRLINIIEEKDEDKFFVSGNSKILEKMKLNKECKRELVAAIIYNLTSVIILLLLKHFKIFDLIGIKPELEIFVWLMAGVAIGRCVLFL